MLVISMIIPSVSNFGQCLAHTGVEFVVEMSMYLSFFETAKAKAKKKKRKRRREHTHI